MASQPIEIGFDAMAADTGAPLSRIDSGSTYTRHQTLKQSLAASLGTTERLTAEDGYFRIATQAPRTERTSPPLFVQMPDTSTSADMALMALQYLPTPIMVLSSSKQVVLANDAMGMMLGLQNQEEEDRMAVMDDEEEDISIGDVLKGQTLSQIGIDMVQDGQIIFVKWEVR